MLAGGYLLFSLQCLGFALLHSGTAFGFLFLLYGLVHGAVEGNQRAFAADLAGGARAGTAMGVFHAATGLATLAASIAAGFIWQKMSPAAVFYCGAAVAAAAAAGMLLSWHPSCSTREEET